MASVDGRLRQFDRTPFLVETLNSWLRTPKMLAVGDVRALYPAYRALP
jgi:hypothetical protein